MSEVPENAHTIWVCIDCYFAYHDGDYTPTDSATPFALFDLSDGARAIHQYVSPGLFASQHSSDCDMHIHNGDAECSFDGECERDTFSSRACDACGSILAGTRDAMTVWESE